MTAEYNSFRSEFEIDKLCDHCRANNKHIDYCLKTTTYYRNKCASIYYFCGKECLNKYEKSKMCKTCHYNDDLKEFNGHMYCTHNPSRVISCFQEARGIYHCNYCGYERCHKINTCHKLESVEGKVSHLCDICYNRYDCLDVDLLGCTELLYLLHKDTKYVCNFCNNIRTVENGLFIVNNANMCRECKFASKS
jgi:hypothetical protein